MNKLAYCWMMGCVCVLASGCDDAAETDGGGGGAGAGAADGGEGGGTTSGIPGEECGDVTCFQGEFCGFAAGMCEGEKSCQPAPEDCAPVAVCGCDGENYASSCLALDAVGGISKDEACDPPEGQFACVYEYQVPIYCDIGTSYCSVLPTADLYQLACLDLPPACGDMPADCSCLDDSCSDNYCGIDDETFAITVLCPFE
jgi:hypothetical protein